MFYKADFQELREFWNGWWNDPLNTRPAVLGVSPKPGMPSSAWPDLYYSENVDSLIEQLFGWVEHNDFSDDLLPSCIVSFGADHFAGLLGVNLVVDKEAMTTWAEPNVTSWADADIKVRWDGEIGKKTIEYVRALRKACDGKILISPPHLQGNLDCLAAMRKPYELLYDLVDDPKGVHRALEKVDEAFTEVIDVFRSEFDTDQLGAVNRHGIYCPGLAGLLQCDFSCMISPEMFKEFALPSLRHEAETVDYAEYHLDGEGAIQHLEDICSIDAIKVIQWQPGETGLDSDWRELHKRIDALGRGQYFWRPKSELREWVVDELKCRNHCFDLIGVSAEC